MARRKTRRKTRRTRRNYSYQTPVPYTRRKTRRKKRRKTRRKTRRLRGGAGQVDLRKQFYKILEDDKAELSPETKDFAKQIIQQISDNIEQIAQIEIPDVNPGKSDLTANLEWFASITSAWLLMALAGTVSAAGGAAAIPISINIVAFLFVIHSFKIFPARDEVARFWGDYGETLSSGFVSQLMNCSKVCTSGFERFCKVCFSMGPPMDSAAVAEEEEMGEGQTLESIIEAMKPREGASGVHIENDIQVFDKVQKDISKLNIPDC